MFTSGAAPALSTILATKGTLGQPPQERGQPASSVCCCHTGYSSSAAWLCLEVDQRQPHNLNVAESREWGYLSSAHVCPSYTSTWRAAILTPCLLGRAMERVFFNILMLTNNLLPVSNQSDSLACTRTRKEVCSLALTSTTLKNKIKVISPHCISFLLHFKA